MMTGWDARLPGRWAEGARRCTNPAGTRTPTVARLPQARFEPETPDLLRRRGRWCACAGRGGGGGRSPVRAHARCCPLPAFRVPAERVTSSGLIRKRRRRQRRQNQGAVVGGRSREPSQRSVTRKWKRTPVPAPVSGPAGAPVLGGRVGGGVRGRLGRGVESLAPPRAPAPSLGRLCPPAFGPPDPPHFFERTGHPHTQFLILCVGVPGVPQLCSPHQESLGTQNPCPNSILTPSASLAASTSSARSRRRLSPVQSLSPATQWPPRHPTPCAFSFYHLQSQSIGHSRISSQGLEETSLAPPWGHCDGGAAVGTLW